MLAAVTISALLLGAAEAASAQAPAGEPARPAAVAAAGLPAFRHVGVVLDYKDLKYNPANDIIFPSVFRTEGRLEKPLGRYYMYYAPHNAPGGICLAYADSLEGPWKEDAANPLIGCKWPPHYAVSHVSGPDAVWNEEERKLFLYYHGENDTTRLASSTDGIHFTYEGVAVTTARFDDINEASYARVIRYPLPDKGSRYLMLLMGNNRGTRKLYLAWSKDGRQWETRRTPFMEPQTRTGQLAPGFYLPWRGKHYLVYHDFDLLNPRDFNANACDLHVSEVDPSFEHTRYLGVFYDHRSAGPDNLAQMSATLIEENGKLYMFTNIGPRLHQKIALATAPAENH